MVAGTLLWDVHNYEIERFCWLQKLPMICMFMGPIMIVVVANTYLFFRVTHEISKSQNRMRHDHLPSNMTSTCNGTRENLVKVRAAISIMALLGLTWIIGPLMLLDMLPPFFSIFAAYLFTICNSLQGFLFFFFHCAIKTDVKERWKTYLGLELSSSNLSNFSRSYDPKISKPALNTHHKTTDFSKLGSTTSEISISKSVLSFKPHNKIRPDGTRPGSADSDLAIVDF